MRLQSFDHEAFSPAMNEIGAQRLYKDCYKQNQLIDDEAMLSKGVHQYLTQKKSNIGLKVRICDNFNKDNYNPPIRTKIHEPRKIPELLPHQKLQATSKYELLHFMKTGRNEDMSFLSEDKHIEHFNFI